MPLSNVRQFLQPSSQLTGPLTALAGLLAVAVIAWETAQITWLIVPAEASGQRTSAATPNMSSQTTAGDTGGSGPDIGPIVNRHLFGQPAAQNAGDRQDIENAPETRLDLKLQGIYFSSVKENSIAIIKPGDQDRELYRVGDTVAGQARITAIQREQVVLERGGRREVLPLETKTLKTASETRAEAAQTKDNEQSEQLTKYRERIQKNPQQLRQLMSPSPVRDDDGNLRGYRIQPGESSELFEVTGLQAGDVVTAIGGTRLDSDQAAMKAMQELGSSNSVAITVERDGSQRRVMLNFGN